MEVRQTLALDRPAVSAVKAPGELDESRTDWDGQMTDTIESQGEGSPVTILTGTVDQAALHSTLRQLYSLGLPMISVVCVECA